MEKVSIAPEEVQKSLHSVEPAMVCGPHICEIGYKEGGMTRLLNEAALGKGGSITLTPSDLYNLQRISDIPYSLRDILARGDSIVLFGTGHTKTIPMKEQETAKKTFPTSEQQVPLWAERTLYDRAAD